MNSGYSFSGMHIKEIHLQTADLDTTIEFYTGKLGAVLVNRKVDSAAMQMGNTTILFQSVKEENPYYHIAFDIPKNKLEEAFKWITQRIPILPVDTNTMYASFENWNTRSFYFYDNNGSVLEFICRNDLPNESHEKFSGDSILYVSEFGVVTDDVNKLSNEIMEKYDLSVYEKQPRQENFTVLGTDTGLFIIVKSGRHWYPVSKPALPFPANVVIESAGIVHQLLLQ